jgi:hypothetical protein
MKRLLLSLSFILMLSSARAETITPAETPHQVGQNATVEGPVSEVHHAASGKVTFIDMGGRYPNNTFTAVIFAD